MLGRNPLHAAMMMATAMAGAVLGGEQQAIHGGDENTAITGWKGRRVISYSPNRKSGAAALKRAKRKARNIKSHKRSASQH